jgi:hypothetical protein
VAPRPLTVRYAMPPPSLSRPYRPPRAPVGSRLSCLARACECVVTGWTAAPIPWPKGIPVGGTGAPSIIITEELARAVRLESGQAVRYWWGVSEKPIWRWRKALGVTRQNNPGTAALYKLGQEAAAASQRGKRLPPEQVERRTALERGLARNLRPGYHGPRWTQEQLALLGTLPDGEVAVLVGRSVTGVRVKRTRLGIPTASASTGRPEIPWHERG